MDALDSLGYDLVLLSLSPSDGKLTTAQRLGFGLMGSELVRLAAAGRVTIDGGRVEVIDAAPGQAGQDPFLDEALASLRRSRRAARAKSWVSRPRRGMAEAYLERLAATGTLQAERSTRLGIFPVTRWRIADAGRQAEARARLDAVALSDGPVSTAQAALAGLAYATGLGAVLYPGRGNRPVRARLERIAKRHEVAASVADAAAASGAAGAADQATAAANQAVAASTQAAVAAATAAATQAAIDAAISAATDAAHSAAHGGGGGAHGH